MISSRSSMQLIPRSESPRSIEKKACMRLRRSRATRDGSAFDEQPQNSEKRLVDASSHPVLPTDGTMSTAALTTIFSPPSSCFNNFYTSDGASVYAKDVSITSSSCYPSGFDALFAASRPYSPGVCPSGYTWDSGTSYGSDATAALCCPS